MGFETLEMLELNLDDAYILGAGMADNRAPVNLRTQGVGTYRDFDT
jgi:hypothetical protein